MNEWQLHNFVTIVFLTDQGGGATMIAIGYTWMAAICVFISYLQYEQLYIQQQCTLAIGNGDTVACYILTSQLAIILTAFAFTFWK